MSFDEVLTLLIEQTTRIMEAERSTLFVVESEGDALVSRVLEGGEVSEIRLPAGTGIAGWVARHAHPLNVSDVYNDARFDSSWDRKSGFVTRCLMCQPIRGRDGKIIGVIEVLNKRNEAVFDENDEELIALLAAQLGLIIENSRLMVDLVAKNLDLVKAKKGLESGNRELDMLLDLEQLVSRSGDLDALTDSVLRRLIDITHAQVGLFYRPDESGAEVRVVVDDRSEYQVFRIGLGVGFEGWVSAKGKELNLFDPASDPRYVDYLKSKLGIALENVAAVPLPDKETGAPFNVLMVANSTLSDRFGESDMALLRLVARRFSQASDDLTRWEKQERDRRLATVGRLLAGVLHDLKSPMAVISGYSELLAYKAGDEEATGYLEQIHSALDRITTMAEEIISFSRGDRELLFSSVNIEEIMNSFFEQIGPFLRSNNVDLETFVRLGGKVRMDKDQMLRAFHNIVNNAVEAMKNGGTLTIEVDKLGKQAVFGFTDTGTGIPDMIQGSIFKSFVTVGKGQGTGLGLAVARKAVEAHGGSISFTTSRGSGTTFLIKIPN
jgi:signal transduction histidine kinase/putative methionine-R-sulfoxide reductase with GAF domain